VFYHSRNETVKLVLSVGLVCVNCVFFIAGLRIFWTEFAKEQDISVQSVAKALRASKMSSIANQLRRTASGRTLATNPVVDAATLSRSSLFDDGDSTVRSNPLVVEQHNRQQIADRSLVGRSSVFQHRARTASVEANSRRLESGTRFGDLKKTRQQLKRLNQYNTLKQKKGARKGKKDATPQPGIEMVPRRRRNDEGLPLKQRRETHLDEATNQYFYIDEEGASQWADEGEGGEEVVEEVVEEGEGGGGETKGVEGGQEGGPRTKKRESHFDPDSNRFYVVVDEDTQETAWLSDTEEEKDVTTRRVGGHGRGVGGGTLSTLGVAMLVGLVWGTVSVQAAFAPADSAAVKAAVGSCSYGVCTGGCLGESADGSCPTFAASNDAAGNSYGVIGNLGVSSVPSVYESKCHLSLSLSVFFVACDSDLGVSSVVVFF
jgi:hypothetical protein